MEFSIDWLQFALQLPVVFILIWLVLSLRNLEREEREERDVQWREFLAHQRDGTVRALEAMTTSMQELSRLSAMIETRTTRMLDILIDHDRHAEELAKGMAVLRAAAKGPKSS